MTGGMNSVPGGIIQAGLADERHWPEITGAICRRCETPVGANARFCLECGTTLRRTERCSDCGAVLGPGGRRCYECGWQTQSAVSRPIMPTRSASVGRAPVRPTL
jgi:predicted amidophosphoribosyltransferase